MNNTEFNQKIDNLKQLKYALDGDQYRLAAATICTQDYLNELKNSNKKFNRQRLMNRVNLMLYKHNIDEVSYGFFRKFNINF